MFINTTTMGKPVLLYYKDVENQSWRVNDAPGKSTDLCGENSTKG